MFRALSVFLLIGVMATVAVAQTAPTENITNACVQTFDPATDYFPAKTEVTDAQNFNVQYFNHYKVIEVQNAFDTAPLFVYVLVQCGTPMPDANDFPEGTQFIEVPSKKAIVLSTTQLPHFVELGLLDKLAGVDSGFYISTPQVRELISAGDLLEVGFGNSVNVELVLDSEADLVFAYGFNPDTDAHPKLIEAGVFTAMNAEWREATPLGRAEWLKYTALFYNAEAQANEAYDNISTTYEATKALVSEIPQEERRVVLWNSFSPYSESWIIPGATTYIGQLITDAGGVIAMGEQAPTESASLSLEAVYAEALDVDVWVLGLFGIGTLDDFLAQDARYADFTALQIGNVWNNDLDTNENGGNNYYELGVTSPHLILQDMVAIFYPNLLPEHAFKFHRLLTPAGE